MLLDGGALPDLASFVALIGFEVAVSASPVVPRCKVLVSLGVLRGEPDCACGTSATVAVSDFPFGESPTLATFLGGPGDMLDSACFNAGGAEVAVSGLSLELSLRLLCLRRVLLV